LPEEIPLKNLKIQSKLFIRSFSKVLAEIIFARGDTTNLVQSDGKIWKKRCVCEFEDDLDCNNKKHRMIFHHFLLNERIVIVLFQASWCMGDGVCVLCIDFWVKFRFRRVF